MPVLRRQLILGRGFKNRRARESPNCDQPDNDTPEYSEVSRPERLTLGWLHVLPLCSVNQFRNNAVLSPHRHRRPYWSPILTGCPAKGSSEQLRLGPCRSQNNARFFVCYSLFKFATMGGMARNLKSNESGQFVRCPTCETAIKQKPIPDSKLRKTVAESLQIWIGTVTLGAILMGFVFTTLSYLLTIETELTWIRQLIIWFLVVTMLLLLSGLILFHLTANQVAAYWGIFFPDSSFRYYGAIAFGGGITLLLVSVATMLMEKGMFVLAMLVIMAALGQVVFVVHKGKMHDLSKPYVRRVDTLCRPAD